MIDVNSRELGVDSGKFDLNEEEKRRRERKHIGGGQGEIVKNPAPSG